MSNNWKIELQELKKQIIHSIAENEKDDNLTSRSLQALLRQLIEIESKLNIEKYKLAFIGEKGVGKTTQINHLFNLTYEKILKNEGIELEEVLTTASGGTTICEVEIYKADTNYIEIEPYSEVEIKQFLITYCEYIWEKFIIKSNKGRIKSPLSSEVARGLRNICGLKNVTIDNKSVNQFAIKAEQHETFESYLQEIQALADLTNRKKTVVNIDGKDVKQKKKNLQKAFNSINLVNFLDMSIPSKINIYLDNELLDMGGIENFAGVIDTRGINSEGITTRRDLDTYIRDCEDTICIFVDEFASVPNSDIIIYMKNAIDAGIKDVQDRMILLVRYEAGEPEGYLTDDGKADDKEIGIQRKLEDSILVELDSIDFKDENILFYNSMDRLERIVENEKCTNRWVLNKNIEEANKVIKENREEILNGINQVVERRKGKLYAKIDCIRKDFEILKNGITLDERVKSKLDYVRTEILGLKPNSNNFYKEIARIHIQEYIKKIEQQHHMRILATNNRFGTYIDFEIYYLAVMCVEEVLIKETREKKAKLEGVLETIYNDSDINKETKVLISTIINQMDIYYRELIRCMRDDVEEITNKLFYSKSLYNPFWRNAKNRWGKGAGYKNAVLNMYKQLIMKKRIIVRGKSIGKCSRNSKKITNPTISIPTYERYISNSLFKNWNSNFIDKLYEFIR